MSVKSRRDGEDVEVTPEMVEEVSVAILDFSREHHSIEPFSRDLLERIFRMLREEPS
jgi:hypothetical protein